MNAFRSFLYWLGRVLGNINAVNKGPASVAESPARLPGAGWESCSSRLGSFRERSYEHRQAAT